MLSYAIVREAHLQDATNSREALVSSEFDDVTNLISDRGIILRLDFDGEEPFVSGPTASPAAATNRRIDQEPIVAREIQSLPPHDALDNPADVHDRHVRPGLPPRALQRAGDVLGHGRGGRGQHQPVEYDGVQRASVHITPGGRAIEHRCPQGANDGPPLFLHGAVAQCQDETHAAQHRRTTPALLTRTVPLLGVPRSLQYEQSRFDREADRELMGRE
mmetsp:Transcript_51256/g.153997  ORF Transcript_51256/g.153997 Transcript_51256/m.153997 type:complete len:218 (-) Transcript_51256:398-1051(-)